MIWLLTWAIIAYAGVSHEMYEKDIKINTYIESVIDTRVNPDRFAGYQCWDLVIDFMNKVYGGLRLQGGSPRWLLRTGIQGWELKKPWITTPPPKAWDIIVLNLNPKYNHIWIVVEATWEYVIVLEQNGTRASWTGLGWDRIRKYTRYYNSVLWWFTPTYINSLSITK